MVSRVIVHWSVPWLMVAALTAAGAESPDARFLEGLRDRQLFELAESYCRDRLSRVHQGEPAQAELTIELIRTLALAGAHAPTDQREALWLKARAAASELLRRSPPHPLSILVRFQDALTPLAQGELGRQEHEAGPLPDERLEATQQALREATSLLETLDKELTREIPLRRRTPPRPVELSADRLFSLQQHVAHQLARAARNRALLFPPKSDDRLALLLPAAEALTRSLSQLADDDPLKATVQLDLAECQRLLGRHDEAGRLAVALDQNEFPVAVRLRARAERIRLAIAQSDLPSIQQLLEQGHAPGQGSNAAELDFARLEALLTLASRRAGTSEGNPLSDANTSAAELAKMYQEQAVEAADFLAETYGTYWGRRANQLLVTTLPRGLAGGSVELLSRTADSLYLQGDLEQALAAYDEAAAAAGKRGESKTAFELAYKAALIEQKQRRHLAAANRLRSLATGVAESEQASQAHLLAAWNAGQAAHADPAAASTYLELLREHLDTWPTADSAKQAHQWLGKEGQLLIDRKRAEEHVAGGRRDEALATYTRLARENPDRGPIQLGYAQLLLSSAEPAHLKQALDQWRIVASRSKPRTPEWYEAKYSVALAQFKLGDRASAATLLRYILETPPRLKGTDWEPAYLELLKRCGD